MRSGQPQIINRTTGDLPAYVEKVLAAMFAGYAQVTVKSEFHKGFSGSRVFLIRPVKVDGGELPAVVKIDHAARIQQEWRAYESYIQNRLPNIADIRGEPTYLPGSEWGGVCYPLVGAGTFDISSLHDYLQAAGIEDIRYTLEARLCKSLGVLWSQTRKVQPDLHLQTHYDSFLPMNLEIELINLPPGAQTSWLHPTTVKSRALQIGEYVQLAGFQVVKVAAHSQKLSLDMPSETAATYRMSLFPIDAAAYEVGDVIHQPLTGIVRQTRREQLREQVAAAAGFAVEDTAVTLPLSNGRPLPNPLHALPHLLNHSFDAYVAYIHGDLNLENVLVEQDSRTAYLIDFAQSRPDHVLRDLLHLETAVITKLLAPALQKNGQAPEAIGAFYEALHCAVLQPAQATPPAWLEKPFAILQIIRQTARHYLYKPDDWSEYYYGLCLYLLGSLRYPDLDKIPGAKAVAFWGTAVTLNLLQAPLPCPPAQQQATPRSDSPAGIYNEGILVTGGNVNIGTATTGPGSRSTHTETHFHGPVTGPVHTGSGNINITNPPRPETKVRQGDLFTAYEKGLEHLLARLGAAHGRYSEALVYQQRLVENIGRARRFGDTPQRQADRAEIIDQLNELALASLSVSFNQLCL